MFPPMEPPIQQPTDLDILNQGTPEAPIEEQPLVADSEEAHILLTLAQEYDQLEDAAREKNVKKWRKHLNYWMGIQYGAWDEVSQIWKTPEEIAEEDPASDIDPALYAKVVNVYKAHGEILIGALTSGIPTVRFFPKDADDHEDVTTAKAFTKAADLVQRQNKARLLLIKSLYLLYNCGFVACYNENKTDYRFGYYQVPTYTDIPIIERTTFCPGCGNEMGKEQFPQEEAAPPPEAVACQDCGYQGVPEIDEQQSQATLQTGVQNKPKNRECLEIHGPLTCKIPFYVKNGAMTPYVCLEDEHPVALLREIYPELADRIQATNYVDDYQEQARVPTIYGPDTPSDMCTVQRWWFQPWALNLWRRDLETIQALKASYPDGLYVVIINKSIVAEIVKDNLEQHWSFAENPLSETLHGEPIGEPMIPMQDIENELDNLTLETIEFGLPEVFADPKVLDFKAYQSQELRPGQVSPASAPSGRSLGEGFHEVKATTLSREVDSFAERMNNRQQFVQGTYPSIYGGVQEGGGGTAREYESSKASALQRLSTTWLILQEWWAIVLDKSTRSFARNMKYDESFVKDAGKNFVNVWVRQIEMTGEVGEISPEIAEPFPVSWAQKRDVLLNLIQMNNEDIAAVIRHPENASLVATLIGLPDLYIPGDDSRSKQLAEISQLIVSEPMMNPMGAPGGPPGGSAPGEGAPPMQPQMSSSVPIDAELDDHYVESEVCKAWLRSEIGLDAKTTNPGGYMNVLQHMKEHLFIFNQMQIAQQQAMAEEKSNKEEGPSEEMGD